MKTKFEIKQKVLISGEVIGICIEKTSGNLVYVIEVEDNDKTHTLKFYEDDTDLYAHDMLKEEFKTWIKK